MDRGTFVNDRFNVYFLVHQTVPKTWHQPQESALLIGCFVVLSYFDRTSHRNFSAPRQIDRLPHNLIPQLATVLLVLLKSFDV